MTAKAQVSCVKKIAIYHIISDDRTTGSYWTVNTLRIVSANLKLYIKTEKRHKSTFLIRSIIMLSLSIMSKQCPALALCANLNCLVIRLSTEYQLTSIVVEILERRHCSMFLTKVLHILQKVVDAVLYIIV